jgi:hypothetical protein
MTHGQACALLWPSLTRLRTWVESGIWRGQAERRRACEGLGGVRRESSILPASWRIQPGGRVSAPYRAHVLISATPLRPPRLLLFAVALEKWLLRRKTRRSIQPTPAPGSSCGLRTEEGL